MLHKFSRTELLIGEEGLKKLADAQVAVFGVGGVGSYTVEGLARAGVGKLVLIDYDDICLTNINRQLHALHSTVGESKVEVMKQRVLDINPKAEVEVHHQFLGKDNSDQLIKPDYSYIVDAIDTVTAKLLLIQRSKELGIPVVSSMGAGNKLKATGFEVVDISETKICPLAKVMRKELRKRGIPQGVKVVYSPEEPITPLKEQVDCKDFCICPNQDANCTKKRQIPGSISFVPSIAGLILTGEVINDLLKV
ncbi:MAG: tRNA threonylcarbamoyladenosine dehydratase [Bacillota bacterium]|nr:tRNA threonylcarbamoyladenosine dehydratase [Bacillota bacterium]